MLAYKAGQKVVTGLLRTVFRARVTGLEHFPKKGPVIVASNHLSFLDSIIISAMMPRRVAFLAKAEYVNTPGIRGKAMKAFFEAVDIIPVNRSDRSESLKALDLALEKNLKRVKSSVSTLKVHDLVTGFYTAAKLV